MTSTYWKQVLSFSAATAMLVIWAGPTFAATTAHPTVPRPTPHQARATSGGTVTVTPEVIRARLLTDNPNILESLNSVYSAKENVSVMRGKLMPALSVSGLLSFNPISFAAAEVSAALPFLLPSNWFNLDTSQKQLAASGYAYYAVELNTYALALSIYETIVTDIAVRKTEYLVYQYYVRIQDHVQVSVELGKESVADLERATAATQTASAEVSNYDILIAQETAQFRQALGYSESTQMVFQDYHPAASALEAQSPTTIFNSVYKKSPEYQEMENLIQASQFMTWSTAFSWLGSISLSAGGGGGGHSVSLTQAPTIGATGNIGFDLGPSIEVSKLATANLVIQEKAIYLDEQSTIESAVNSIAPALQQLNEDTQATDNATKALTAYLGLFSTGQTDLQTMITIAQQLDTAAISQVLAQNILDGQRIDLERITISSQFTGVPKCSLIGNETGNGFFGFLTDMFSAQQNVATVDQVCKASPRASHAASGASGMPPLGSGSGPSGIVSGITQIFGGGTTHH